MQVCGVCRFPVVVSCGTCGAPVHVSQVTCGSGFLSSNGLAFGFPLAWGGWGGVGGFLWPGVWGGWVGRRGLSVPRLPRASKKRAGSHASVLYRAFLPSCLSSSAELPGLLPLPGPIPKSKCAVVDTKEDRSACQVIPKVGVVTLLGCHKPGANLHQPGIEPGSHRWQRCILPLDH